MEHKQPISNIDELLLRCLEGVASDAAYEQAWQWVHQSPQNQAYYHTIRDAWIAADLVKPVDPKRQRQAWLQFEKKAQPAKTHSKIVRINFLRWTATAAVIVLAYLLGLQTPAKWDNQQIVQSGHTIEAPKGGKSVLTLSDGSRVWLNAGSTLYFDNSFGAQHRTLALQGEAYFEVAHNPNRLFLVETSGITIAALGTAFNVKAYPDEELIETTLVEGSVRIETKTQSGAVIDPIVLEPNQKATFYKNRQSLSVNSADTTHTTQEEQVELSSFSKVEIAKEVDVAVSTSWRDKRWIVRSESLGALARIIERKYDVTLIFEQAELEAYKISATLEEETIEQLLNAIRLTIPMDYTIERDQVYLKLNRQLKEKYDRLIQNN